MVAVTILVSSVVLVTGRLLNSTITELYVDPTTLTAKVKWSKGSAARGFDTTVAIPTALKVGNTYLIYSEVDYTYTPTVGYFMFTRPRYGLCVLYATATTCPV